MEHVNPFDGNGFTLASMTRSINKIANRYGRLNQLGLFKSEPITQRVATFEEKEGELSLLPSLPLGAPSTMGTRETAKMRAFSVPHIPHDDVVLPNDIQGIREFGTADRMATLASILAPKLDRMRQKHAQTLEFMRLSALKGELTDGAGRMLYNYFTEFDITQTGFDFKLGDSNTDVPKIIRMMKRHFDEKARGELINGYHVLVGPEFFEAFIVHASVEKAYKHYQAVKGSNPLADDVRDGFKFHGVIFEEYNATFSLHGGTSKKAFDGKTGAGFPTGTLDTFVNHFSPANLIPTVNTLGRELYAQQKMRDNGKAVDIFTESNPLPLVKRPELAVKVKSSS